MFVLCKLRDVEGIQLSTLTTTIKFCGITEHFHFNYSDRYRQSGCVYELQILLWVGHDGQSEALALFFTAFF